MRRRRIFAGPSLALVLALVGLLGVSGAVPPGSPGPDTLSVDNSALSRTPNVQITGR